MKANIVILFFLILCVLINCDLSGDFNKTVYISPLDLGRYHNYDCRILDEIKDKSKIISIKKQEAIERKIRPCIICDP